MAKKECINCGRPIGFTTGRIKCRDGFLCTECFNGTGLSAMKPQDISVAGNMTIEEIKAAGQNRQLALQRVQQFIPTYVPASFAQFNDDSKEMLLSKKQHIAYKPKHFTLFRYDQIVDFEIIEDGNSIASGGLGRAAVGGILFGGAGAIAGGVTGRKKSKQTCDRLEIKITVKDYIEPVFYITLLNAEMKKKSLTYKTCIKTAEAIVSKLQLIANEQAEQQATAQSVNIQQSTPQLSPEEQIDAADEIRKFKELCDDGIITQEEFEAKKKQLLGL